MNYVTEIYDLLTDLNFPNDTNRADYITGGIPENFYNDGRVNYNPNTKHWIIPLPRTNYEFTKVTFKCFTPIPLATYSKDMEPFICCNISPNISKRIAFGLTNLTSGVEIAPLNGALEIEIWLENPIYNTHPTLLEISQYFYNLVLNIDLLIK